MNNQPKSTTRVAYVTLEPPAPSPEKSPSSYTSEKIQDRLRFVQITKAIGDITPRCEIFLRLYTDAAENGLIRHLKKQSDLKPQCGRRKGGL